MTSKAAQAGFAVLKEDWFEGPMDSMDRQDSPVSAPSMPVRGMPPREDMVRSAAELFIGTLDGFLSADQEDYVAQHLPEASMDEIEAGRDLAMQIVSTLKV